MEYNDPKVDAFKQKYLIEVVQKSFPFIKYFVGSSFSSSGNEIPELSLRLFNYYNQLKGSVYYYSNNTNLIHYTSIHNAINIINDGYFRLNSLAYMDDPQELTFAGKFFEFEKLKKKVYSMSFCEHDDDKHKDNFDAWRLYGDNGRGVGIVGKFTSNVDLWQGNFISKMHYGTDFNYNGLSDSTQKFELLKKNHEEFIEKNKDEFILTNDYFKSEKFPDWLAILLSFHKSTLYKIEDEVRFLRFFAPVDSFTINSFYDLTYYSKLLIMTKQNIKNSIKNNSRYPESINMHDLKMIEDITKLDPMFKIEKIIIGYRHEANFKKLKQVFENGFLEKNHWTIKAVLSDIAENF